MARTETTPDARVLVGVDISKHRHEVLISVPGKQRRRRVTLTNTKADFERMVGVLSGYGLPVRIGFEATGNYHRALTHHLSCAGSSSNWCRRSPWRARGRLCTTAGTRTIRRTRR